MGQKPWWWLRQSLSILAGLLFLGFGLELLVAAYSLPDPFSFVLTFFASNLIILISLALLSVFFLQILRLRKRNPPGP